VTPAIAIEEVLEAARAAFDHHLAGYDTGCPWDADHQIDLMDLLGVAIDRFDAAQGMAARSGETACGLDPKGNSPVAEGDAPKEAS